MGEENNRTPKRLIRVKKFRANPAQVNQEEEEEESALDVASSSRDPDSNFAGGEEVIQIIEPGNLSDSSTSHPIEFMFPHLKQEGLDTVNLTKTMSTTDITKLLVGKKARITDRKRCMRRQAVDFTTIVEEDETSSSEDETKAPKIKLPALPAEATDDGNESDDDEEESDGN